MKDALRFVKVVGLTSIIAIVSACAPLPSAPVKQGYKPAAKVQAKAPVRKKAVVRKAKRAVPVVEQGGNGDGGGGGDGGGDGGGWG